MVLLSVFLIAIALGVYLTPTISIYNKLKKYDDKTPGFFMMQLKMPYYLKKCRKIDKIQIGRDSNISKLWYLTLFSSIIMIALAFMILL
jgi:hypothetical protein